MTKYFCVLLKLALNTNQSILSIFYFIFSVVDGGGHILKRESVKIVAPIYNPDKVLCIGMNYVDHCQEQNAPVPEVPVIFNKFPSCIIGPTDNLPYPDETEVR